MWFADWCEDPKLAFNGTEWTSLYYFGVVKNVNKEYNPEEYEKGKQNEIEAGL